MYYLKRKPKKGGRPSTAALVRKLDKVFSEFIRRRDSRPYGYRYFRCISCGQIKPFEQMDCGHFIGRTRMATRFDEENCHGECRSCNRFSADHMIYYQRNLERLIGRDRLDLLVAKGNRTRKWSAFELETLIRYYTARVEEMRAGL